MGSWRKSRLIKLTLFNLDQINHPTAAGCAVFPFLFVSFFPRQQWESRFQLTFFASQWKSLLRFYNFVSALVCNENWLSLIRKSSGWHAINCFRDSRVVVGKSSFTRYKWNQTAKMALGIYMKREKGACRLSRRRFLITFFFLFKTSCTTKTPLAK